MTLDPVTSAAASVGAAKGHSVLTWALGVCSALVLGVSGYLWKRNDAKLDDHSKKLGDHARDIAELKATAIGDDTIQALRAEFTAGLQSVHSNIDRKHSELTNRIDNLLHAMARTHQ